MSEDFWQRLLTQSSRRAGHVGHSIVMVGELPVARAAANQAVEQIAFLESWLIHVRLLAEFLLIHPANQKKDFSAADFGWTGASGFDTSEIERMWVIASQHLVHFSHERTPEDVHALEAADVSTEGLVRISAAVLDVAETFVRHLEEATHPEWPVFRQHVDQARRALQQVGP